VCDFCRTTGLSVPNTGSREEFYGLSANKPLSHERVECIKKEYPLSQEPVHFKNRRGSPCLFILDDLLNEAFAVDSCAISLGEKVIIEISVPFL